VRPEPGLIYARGGNRNAGFSFISVPDQRKADMITVAHIQPIVALIAGILILIVPRLLNYIVAIYLIFVGIVGLGLIR
jgi:hypothetical protein